MDILTPCCTIVPPDKQPPPQLHTSLDIAVPEEHLLLPSSPEQGLSQQPVITIAVPEEHLSTTPPLAQGPSQQLVVTPVKSVPSFIPVASPVLCGRLLSQPTEVSPPSQDTVIVTVNVKHMVTIYRNW